MIDSSFKILPYPMPKVPSHSGPLTDRISTFVADSQIFTNPLSLKNATLTNRPSEPVNSPCLCLWKLEDVLQLMKKDGLLIQFVNPELQNDPVVVYHAVEQNVDAFQFVSSALFGEDFLILLGSQFPKICRYLDLKNHTQRFLNIFSLATSPTDLEEIVKWGDPNFLSDPSLIRVYPDLFPYLDESLRHNKGFVEECIKARGSADFLYLQIDPPSPFILEEKICDKDLALALIESYNKEDVSSGLYRERSFFDYYQRLSITLQADPDVRAAALRKEPDFLN